VLIQDLEDEEARPDEGGMLRVTKRGAISRFSGTRLSAAEGGDPVTAPSNARSKAVCSSISAA